MYIVSYSYQFWVKCYFSIKLIPPRDARISTNSLAHTPTIINANVIIALVIINNRWQLWWYVEFKTPNIVV